LIVHAVALLIPLQESVDDWPDAIVDGLVVNDPIPIAACVNVIDTV
jgi:hypothetical protein